MFLILFAAVRFLAKGFGFIALAIIVSAISMKSRPCPLPRSGRVISVMDGNRLIVASPDHSAWQTVKLASVEAPEIALPLVEPSPAQPYAEQAKQRVIIETLNQNVTLRCYERDNHLRAACDVFRDGRSINRDLVASGLAWADRERSKDFHEGAMLALEASARAARRGLWADSHPPVPPWVWRQQCWIDRRCGPPPDGGGDKKVFVSRYAIAPES